MHLKWVCVIAVVAVTVFAMGIPAVQAETLTKVFCVDDGSWEDDENWRLDDCEGDSTIQPDDDDHAIIDTNITCELNESGEGCGDLTVRSGATLNINDGKTLQITGDSGTTSSTITGTLNLTAANSKLNVTDNDHTFTGTGTIVGQHADAQIDLGGNVTLTNETTIAGILRIERTLVGGDTFRNDGTVNANASGILVINASTVADGSNGEWTVTASGATLRFDPDGSTQATLVGAFTVSAGVLDIDPPGLTTTGALTFTGGTIDCADLGSEEVAEFTGS